MTLKCTFCAVCIKQMFQYSVGGLNYGLRSHLPLLEGLTYLCHLYAHVKIMIKGVVKVMKQIWTCNLHLLMVIVMSRVMSPVEQVPLIEHPLPDGSQMLFVLFYTFIMMIQPSLKVTVNPDLLCHLMGTPEHYEKSC